MTVSYYKVEQLRELAYKAIENEFASDENGGRYDFFVATSNDLDY